MFDRDDGVHEGLRFSPKARDALRRVLIRDQADRDAIAQALIRCRRRSRATNRADIIDFPTMYPDAKRRVVRVLAEIDAS